MRDRIPEIVRASGGHYKIRTLAAKAYALALSEKLLEEAREVVEASEEEILKELADLCEGVDAVAKLNGFDVNEVRQLQAEKRDRRRGFEGRVFLESFGKVSKKA